MFPVAETTAVVAHATAAVADDDIWEVLAFQAFDIMFLVLLLSIRFRPNSSTKETPLVRPEMLFTRVKLEILNRILDSLDTNLDRLDRKK
jgi:hypothetical protein